ncbi:unnamed protein product, partial [Mesorhabditis belari]|uniref:Uncharacterized protein n=1 Tax=Mesorhabditis belari TaxID=2138241 RepID=A0AAF3JAF9_9BILA
MECSVRGQREEAKIRKALEIEKLEAKEALKINPTRSLTKLLDLPLVNIDVPLSKSILRDRVELSKLLRRLLVANGGKIEYSTLLQLLDIERHDDQSFWMETITPGVHEFGGFYWEIDPNAPEKAKRLFSAGKSSQSDAVFFFWLKLRELTFDEQEDLQKLTTTLNFIPQMIAYFLEKELEFEEKVNICKIFDLDPDSSLVLIAKLFSDVFTYDNVMHRLVFHKEKWAKEDKKTTGLEDGKRSAHR